MNIKLPTWLQWRRRKDSLSHFEMRKKVRLRTDQLLKHQATKKETQEEMAGQAT